MNSELRVLIAIICIATLFFHKTQVNIPKPPQGASFSWN